MDMHGFDDPPGEIHTMYAPDVPEDSDDGLGQDDPLDPTSTLAGQGGASPGDHRTVELDIDGRSSALPVTLDTDHDGRADSAVLTTEDGHRVVVADSDQDGVADQALLLDEHGNVVDSATFDEASGHWHHAEPTAAGGSDHTGASSAGPERGTPGATGPVAGAPSAAGGPDATGQSTQPDGPHGAGVQIEVDADGNHARVSATLDTDQDGRADTAVVDAGGTSVAFTDSDDDGRADEAALIDGSGRVTETAHIDPRTGQWVSGADGHNPFNIGDRVLDGGTTPASTGSGTGADSGAGATAGTTTGPVGPGEHDSTGESTSTASSQPSAAPDGPITVDAGGRTSTVEATVDANRDGVNETAIVHGPDGSRVAFSDTDGDGEADRATVFDAQGNVVGTARFDPASGEWRDEP